MDLVVQTITARGDDTHRSQISTGPHPRQTTGVIQKKPCFQRCAQGVDIFSSRPMNVSCMTPWDSVPIRRSVRQILRGQIRASRIAGRV